MTSSAHDRPMLLARALDVRGSRDGRPQLRAVDLELRRGEVVGLVGPNGAGKSTLLRALAGLLPAHAGRVLVHGRPIASLDPRSIARVVAWRAQHLDAVFGLRAIDTVLLGRMPWHPPLSPPSSDDHNLALAALEEVAMDGLAERNILSLSGGERQRVHVASALAQGTDALLLDEPTSAQDFDGTARIVDALHRRADAGACVVVALHDLSLAARACDRLVLLHAGRVLDDAAPWDVIASSAFEEAFGAAVHRVAPSPDHPGWVGAQLRAPRAANGRPSGR